MTRACAFVTANTFEFDSRHRRAADALAEDGWAVVVVAMAAPHPTVWKRTSSIREASIRR